MLRLMSLVYWSLLSLLLLAPNPAALLFDLAPLRVAGSMRGIHFAAFLLLGLLVQSARWPIPRRPLWIVLGAYAVLIESLQVLVPNRTVDPLDYAENLLGLAVAAALLWRLPQTQGNSRPRRA